MKNMFLAIVTDTYSEVKSEVESSDKSTDLSHYIKRGGARIYNRLFSKNKQKHDQSKEQGGGDEEGLKSYSPGRNNTMDTYDQIRNTLQLYAYFSKAKPRFILFYVILLSSVAILLT